MRSDFFEIGHTMSDLKKNAGRRPMSKISRVNSGPTPVARSGSGAKAPLLAARTALASYHGRTREFWAGIQVGVFESRVSCW